MAGGSHHCVVVHNPVLPPLSLKKLQVACCHKAARVYGLMPIRKQVKISALQTDY